MTATRDGEPLFPSVSERTTDAELTSIRDWCLSREADKPWYGEFGDSPKLLTKCDFMVALITEVLAARIPPKEPPHTRTGYTTVDTSEGEQAKPCYPDPVMDAVRRCAEIAEMTLRVERTDTPFAVFIETIPPAKHHADRIRREFGLLPTSET